MRDRRKAHRVLLALASVFWVGSSPLFGATITGTVVDPSAVGVENVDLDVLETATGNCVPVVGDLTDSSGNFSITVPDNNTYDLLVRAPLATRLVSTIREGIAVTVGNQGIGTVTLEAGGLLQGTVLRQADLSPVAGVGMKVRDELGEPVFTPDDATDALGSFSLVVPLTTVSIEYRPDFGERLVARVQDVVVTGDTNLGNVELELGAVLSGTVVRLSGGAPVVDADTDSERSADGSRVVTPGDNTDDFGFFQVIVPLAMVDLSIEPDKADRLVGVNVTDIAVTGDTDLGTISLADGALLSGRVVRSLGGAVVGADLDVDEAATLARVPTAGDNTDSLGDFSVVVPLTRVHVTIEPRKSDRVVGKRILDVDIMGDTDLGTLALEDGALLTGRVVRVSNGMPVVGADTDTMGSLSGDSVVTPGDDTDAAGNFSVVVPLGKNIFSIEPVISDRLVAFRQVDLEVLSDIDLGTISLGDGFLISGTVRDSQGPLLGVGATAFDETTGARVPIPRNRSRPDGTYSFVLPAGTFVLKWSPELGGGTARFIETGFVVAGDRGFDPTLVAAALSVRIGETGHLVEAGGRFKPLVSLRNNSGASQPIRAILQADVPSRGILRDLGPPTDKNLPGVSNVLSATINVRIPNDVAPSLRNTAIYIRVRVLEQGTLNLIDEDFVEFEIDN